MLIFDIKKLQNRDSEAGICEQKIAKFLEELGYSEKVVDTDNPFANSYKENIHIYIFTSRTIEMAPDLVPMIRMRNCFLNSGENKFFIPLFMHDIDDGKIPSLFLHQSQFLNVRNNDIHLRKIAETINAEVQYQMFTRLEKERFSEEIKANIKASAPDYIEETLVNLRKKETTNRYFANGYYLLGFLLIVAAIFGALILYEQNNLIISTTWNIVVYITIRNMLVITLMLAAAKDSFSLAKSYMQESLKPDRMHAISFGKFYLNVFKEVSPDELKEIFRDWNINAGSPSFKDGKSDDFDPRYIEQLNEGIKSFKALIDKSS